jgi:uncharacterized protein YceH (UPF0502 family)
MTLTPIEARVLGSLVEKDITTPDYYPLSLNALVNACNQKNNREPVMTLDEDAVRDALSGLQSERLAGPATGADSRVTKYEHRLQEVYNFTRGEIAVLCVLLLRGPQTLGELRGRTERMHRFEDLDQVQAALQRLMQREPPLAAVLPRQPGTKEARYAHLMSGEIPASEPASQVRPAVGLTRDSKQPASAAEVPVSATADSNLRDRVAQLEQTVSELRSRVEDVTNELTNFRRQFQ